MKIVILVIIILMITILGAWNRYRGQQKAEEVARQVLGMTENRARKHLRQNGVEFCVARKDNVSFFTKDTPNQVRLTIKDGKVINYKM